MNSSFIAEWQEQDGVILAFPHEDTDWSDYLIQAQKCVVDIVKAITPYEKVYLLCEDMTETMGHFSTKDNIHFIVCDFNDTWMRDCNVLACTTATGIVYKGFEFTGWGGKFDASLDNQLKYSLASQGVYREESFQAIDYILEGGAVESDGRNRILTTTSCLLNPNRNPVHDKQNVEKVLKDTLGTQSVLWLHHGHLLGDDTDGHIDTLARFCDEKTIAYVGLPPLEDEHYESISLMIEELKDFRDHDNQPYHLVALPFVPAMYDDDERLPATYANFLIINGAVLVPTYGVAEDKEALDILQEIFSDRKIIGIDCQVLVKQHGSLHCMTMQLPKL